MKCEQGVKLGIILEQTKKKLMTHLYKNKIKRHKMHFPQDKEQSNIKCNDLSGDPFTYLNDILHVEKYQMTKLACSVRSEDMGSREIQPFCYLNIPLTRCFTEIKNMFYILFLQEWVYASENYR